MRSLIILTALLGVSLAQFENGHVKILQDKRYQDGASFGNFRQQEDGVQYQEETDADGVRRGFWEYPDSTGRLLRVRFEAGPGIGFRIIESNYLAPTPIATNSVLPAEPARLVTPAPAPVRPVAPPVKQAVPVVRQPVAPVRPVTPVRPVSPVRPVVPVRPVAPLPRASPLLVERTTPRGPIFDYPGNLEFSRSASGHRFKFQAS